MLDWLEDISYINLHGTGTPDNDLTESRAVKRLFTTPPPLSSIKGATGHSLAAAGALEAVVSTIAVSSDLLPANTSLQTVDPELGVNPLLDPTSSPVQVVLANSFGFGGNNGSLVLGKPGINTAETVNRCGRKLGVHGYFCLSGAGDTTATMKRLRSGGSVAGQAGPDTLSENLPPRVVRRLKRLPRLALALAVGAQNNAGPDQQPIDSVYMGTGWGALSETHDFLSRLNESNEQFPSPTDFIGSVHNAPASQVAIMFKATGANITTSGGDYSFEQALLAAELMYHDHDEVQKMALVLAGDEGHEKFSPLFDPSVVPGSVLADGGAGFCVSRTTEGAKCTISIPFYQRSTNDEVIEVMLDSLSCIAKGKSSCAAVLVGIPEAMRSQGEEQLKQFLNATEMSIPVIDYRKYTGEFASASAVAVSFATAFIEAGCVPGILVDGEDVVIDSTNNSLLILGLGEYVTAMEISKL